MNSSPKRAFSEASRKSAMIASSIPHKTRRRLPSNDRGYAIEERIRGGSQVGLNVRGCRLSARRSHDDFDVVTRAQRRTCAGNNQTSRRRATYRLFKLAVSGKGESIVRRRSW